jgi:MoxR-like ATPase
MTARVRLDAEMRSYIHNIAIFLRTHRCVAGGVSALATRHLLSLSHVLAPLHGLDYVSPGLVTLAARKVYPHRIVLATQDNERSLMWGSDVEAVREMLEGVTVEDVIEDVLASVPTPL